MKRLIFIFILFVTVDCISQVSNDIRIAGNILVNDTIPLENVYVINFRDFKTVHTDENGRFNIWVQRGDSLAISHIGYIKKIIKAESDCTNAKIFLELDTINMRQINIFSKPIDIYQNARQTVKQVKGTRFPTYSKISPEKNLVNDFVTEHNKLLRNEASSLSLIRISPSEVISTISRKLKVRKSIRKNRNRNAE